jgi:dihydrofolate reductase
MRKLKSYIAISLNGKIAAKDGSVDWLETIPNPDKLDYGYADFYNSIDTTIQGYSTYNQIIDWGIDFPYVGKQNYVLTRKQNLKNTEHVTFLNENAFEFIEALKKKEGKDIWVIGGGQINTMLLNEKLIDEIQVFVMPIIISDGINLFEMLPKQSHLELIESKNFPTGVVELKYKVIN